MLYVSISLAVFILTVILHILTHKILLKFSYENYKIFIPVFILGFIVDVFIILSLSNNILNGTGNYNWWTEKFIWTPLMLFILLTISFFVFFSSPLGEESPSSVILLLIRKAKRLTGNQILSRFSDDRLIKKRLDYLTILGWIRKKDKMYSILPKGDMIAAKIFIYRKILGWEKFG